MISQIIKVFTQEDLDLIKDALNSFLYCDAGIPTTELVEKVKSLLEKIK